jgi:hypothetical protein
MRAPYGLGRQGCQGRALYSRCLVDGLVITCASCGRRWTTAVPFSVYEQQAVESCPCTQCGAYTLCCGEHITTKPALFAAHAGTWSAAALQRAVIPGT